MWATVTWATVRAGGITAYILLSLSVILGMALSMQWQSPSRWPRLINNELHNYITLLASIFVVLHILAAWIDPFTTFGLNEILIPFASHYRTIWMALGIVAFYLGIAIGLSTWLRPVIGYKTWRYLHYSTLGIYVLATIHGIFTGTDTTPWGLLLYGISIIAVGAVFTRRVWTAMHKQPIQPVAPRRVPREQQPKPPIPQFQQAHPH